MDLFDDIQNHFCLLYLSDIHFMPFKADVIRYMLRIENEKYSQAEWLDLLQYLTGNEQNKQISIDRIKHRLSDILEEPTSTEKRKQAEKQ